MGIGADNWDWLPGRTVRENHTFYPEQPGYGLFIDPPYEVDGIPVIGGGGWVVMSAMDLARVGLLFAVDGRWEGEKLLGQSFLVTEGQKPGIRGWNGGNSSGLRVWAGQKLLLAFVTTGGKLYVDYGLPETLISNGNGHA
jgi:hypothetical protein